RAFFVLIGFFAGDRLMLCRVELLAHRGDLRNTLRLQRVFELAGDQLDAVEPVPIDAFGRVFERAAKVVQDRQQFANQFLVRVLGSVGQFLAGSALVVFEVGRQPLVAGEGLLRLATNGLQFGVGCLAGRI